MTQNQESQLRGWVLDAIDSLTHIDNIHCLLEIAIEQLDYSPGNEEEALSRVETLLRCYKGSLETERDEIRANLERVRNTIGGVDP